jgi:glycosyltransferase involved in cell wall biosynthesis
MGSRKKIALTFHYSENWIAGSYYVVNILKALNSLDDEEKPKLYILLSGRTGIHMLQEVGYPYIEFINTNCNDDGFWGKYLRRISLKFFRKDYPVQLMLSGVDHVFEGNEQFGFIKNHYYWVHDFQECRLPEFFTAQEAAERSALPKKISRVSNATLILSSYDALNDFGTFFPGYVCKVKVLRFASSLPDFSSIDFNELKKEFDIRQPFFICSNQFWQHKNHRVVLEAIKILKEKGLKFQVLFTGKNYDHRNPKYFTGLTDLVSDYQINDWVKFLGFIDRKVQLCMAKNAMSYIQPSLFEGWSTTVEDAKCLNQHVLLSDIPVHREQLTYNVDFFNPHDPIDLAEKMEKIISGNTTHRPANYGDNIKAFGKDIIAAFS